MSIMKMQKWTLWGSLAAVTVIGPVAAFAQPAAPPAPAAPRARSVSNVYVASPGSTSYVGVFLAEIDGERAKNLKLKEERGVEITKVEEDSPAAKAGLKAGDVVLDYNGQRVEGIEQFRRFVRETPAGRDVKVTLSRDGYTQNVVVRVGARKAAVMGIEPMVSMVAPKVEMPEFPRGGVFMWSGAALGIEAEGLEGQLAQYFGVKEGVLVRSVMKGSAAEKAGIRAGDVITKVEDTQVSSPSELTRAVRTARKNAPSGKGFAVGLMREKKETSVTVTVDPEDRSESPFQFFNGQPQVAPRAAGRVIRL
jgi:serine protease Do